MIDNSATLSYIVAVTGKPVLVIYNKEEKDLINKEQCKRYFYLIDEFKPAVPSNHIFDNSVSGRDLSGMLNSIQGYAHGNNSTSEHAIMTKIEEIPVIKFTFNGFNWIKIAQ